MGPMSGPTRFSGAENVYRQFQSRHGPKSIARHPERTHRVPAPDRHAHGLPGAVPGARVAVN
ncbi:hypothetical protein [Streptomyces sp. NPDC001642]|uniref:hypothetical protein n=1 Tax=Streptomyces sp. NPDC001642 TaxID=3154392 RepID=UPI00333258AE